MKTLTELQAEQAEWAHDNFETYHDDHWWVPLLGAAEELGELCHAALKEHQGIRGYDHAKTREAEKDAIGDTVIYLMDFCNRRGYDMGEVVNEVWDQVKERNWKERPVTG